MNKRATIFFLVSFLLSNKVIAGQEMLKTSRVRVGETAPLTDSLKRTNEAGKVIVMTLFPNPMGCRRCDSMVELIRDEAQAYKGTAEFTMKGGEDMLGATDEETVILKRSYGFVTMGEPWTFIIDKKGVLRKIIIGSLTKEEMEEGISSVIEVKE